MFAMITQEYTDGDEVHYRIPVKIAGKFFWAAALKQKRSFAYDYHKAIAGTRPKSTYKFREHIPPTILF